MSVFDTFPQDSRILSFLPFLKYLLLIIYYVFIYSFLKMKSHTVTQVGLELTK